MLFNSVKFMLFFPATLVVFFLVPRKLRQVWLLISSYFFYMCWKAEYALLILGVTLITYACALLIEKFPGSKKLFLAGSLVVAFSVLFLFKYFNLFTGRDIGLILPVGISFYTFQAVGYSVDVYRGDIKAEKNFIRYALFVSFFPQLVAGPIERSGNLLTQIDAIQDKELWDFNRITSGAVLMVWGYFLKMVIADRAAVFVDAVYNQAYMYGTVELVLATVVFAIQIYCDFMSYSTIAIGAAKIMGFNLMENFNTPYFAVSIKDFWRRWHISLSTWFRDYLYFPLGGNRKGKLRTYLNTMIVFLASGFWHGAEWSFVVWGALHGFFQIVGDATLSFRQKARRLLHVRENAFSFRLGQTFWTFVLVCFSWIFFRAANIGEALMIIRRIVTAWNPWVLFDKSVFGIGMQPSQWNILILAVAVLFLVSLNLHRKRLSFENALARQNLLFRWLVLGVMIFSIVIFGMYGPQFDANAFIYFQF